MALGSSSNNSSSTLLIGAATTIVVGAIGYLASWATTTAKQRQWQQQRTKSKNNDDETTTCDSIVSVEGSVMVTLPTWAIADPTTLEYFNRHYHTDNEMMALAIHLSDRNITEGTGGPFGACIFERHYNNNTSNNNGDGNNGDYGSSYCTLVSIGMNRVVPLGNSTLHGEMVAIQLAQRKVGSFTLMLDNTNGDDDNIMDANDNNNGNDGLFYDEPKEEEGEEEKVKEGGNKIIMKMKEEKQEDATVQQTQPKKKKKKRQFELFTSCEPCAMCLGATLWSGVSRIVCGATKADAQAIGFDEGPVYQQSYDHLEKAGVQVTRGVLALEAARVLQRYGNTGLIYNR